MDSTPLRVCYILPSLIIFVFSFQDLACAQKLAQKIFAAMMKRQQDFHAGRGRAFLLARAKLQKLQKH